MQMTLTKTPLTGTQLPSPPEMSQSLATVAPQSKQFSLPERGWGEDEERKRKNSGMLPNTGGRLSLPELTEEKVASQFRRGIYWSKIRKKRFKSIREFMSQKELS